MYLCKKTLEKLRNIINGDSTDDYKSGPMLVAFLMNLALIIFMVKDFQLEGFLGYLDKLIAEFNQYLAFDTWEVRDNGDITFKKLDKIIIEKQEQKIEISENNF